MFKRMIRRGIKLLPPEVRQEIIRRNLKIKVDACRGLVFKIAETKDELEQAFKLLHDCYVEEGFMDPQPSGLRITPYHALPTTTTLIAKEGDKVVGTISIIADGGYGVPMEKIFDQKLFRRAGKRVAEISSLAIDRSMRRNGRVFFPLQKFAINYMLDYLNIDDIIIAVHPRTIDYFEAIMEFKLISGSTERTYDFVKGNPAVALILNLHTFRQEGQASDLPVDRCLKRYIATKGLGENFRFPARKFYQIFDGVMTPRNLAYFFKEKSDAFSGLSPFQVDILHYIYRSPEYLDVLPPLVEKVFSDRRKHPRFNVFCNALSESQQSGAGVALQILDVSQGGFRAALSEPVAFGKAIPVKVALGEFFVAELKAMPVWSTPDHIFGFKILQATTEWQLFLNNLEQNSYGIAA